MTDTRSSTDLSGLRQAIAGCLSALHLETFVDKDDNQELGVTIVGHSRAVDKIMAILAVRGVAQPPIAPTDLNKVWQCAEACWASSAPDKAVDTLYYEILRLLRHPVTGFDINDVSAASPLPSTEGK